MAKGLHYEKPHSRIAPQVDPRLKHARQSIPRVSASEFYALVTSVTALPLDAAKAMRHGRYRVK